MSLRLLLIIHSIILFAASVVLVIAPTLIPGTVNIHLLPGQYLLCYFLGAAELGFACLSFFSIKITDRCSLRLICTSFIVFHAATGMLEVYAFFQGISNKIIANVIVRILVVILFAYYGVYKNKDQKNNETKIDIERS